MHILIVKMSSLGDVVQMLPTVHDIRNHSQGAAVDWVVEEQFAAIPALHPAVRRVVPVALRRWRSVLARRETRRELREFIERLRAERYDCILDTQGLVKSAVVARLARGTRYGFSRAACREAAAGYLYDAPVRVPPGLPAVEKYRQLAAGALGYRVQGTAIYGIDAPQCEMPFAVPPRYAVLLHSTARADKLWPDAAWCEVAAALARRGLSIVLPWGSAAEAERSRRLAAAMTGAVVPPALSLTQAAALLGGACIVIALDTGLAYLASALARPVVRIYVGIDRGDTRLYVAPRNVNVGAPGAPPRAGEVIAAIEGLLAHDAVLRSAGAVS